MNAWVDIDPAEAESRSRSLRRRLSDIEQAMQEQLAALREKPDSFAFRLGWKSLASMQERLKGDLAVVTVHRASEQLTVILDGAKFNREADLGTLGTLLIRLQKLYTSIGQAITRGPTLRGPISGAIRDMTQLRLQTTFASSFGMHMTVPADYDLMGNSVPTSALETMFQLLNATNDESRLMQMSGEIGRRSFGHLRHIAIALRDADADLKTEWRDLAGTQYSWHLRRGDAAGVIANLGNISETRTGEITTRGRLVGASLLRNRFEFLSDDGAIYDGKFVVGLGPSIRAAFGEECMATIDETEVADLGSGESRVYFSLRELTAP